MKRSISRLSLYPAILCLLCSTAPAADQAQQQSLRDYKDRIASARTQISNIIVSAEAFTTRLSKNPAALLNVPYWEQPAFAEEMLNRSGGLALALPTVERAEDATDQDVVLLSVRSWEVDAEKTRQLLKQYTEKKWVTVLFASAAGCPADVKPDFLIDNGAPTAGKEHGRINILSNVTLGWMWCCEYVSAMTRQGKMPGVLMSIAVPGGQEFDAKIQTREGRHSLEPCSNAVPAGKLAALYLDRVNSLVEDLESEARQKQVKDAAEIVASRMKAGGTVGLAGVGHLILFEVEQDNKAPWKGFSGMEVQGGGIKKFLKPGDVLAWIGYYGGVNSKYFDFAKALHDAQVDVITCYAPDPSEPPSINDLKPLAHIDQAWKLGDAEVPLPAAPGHMAPVSGLNSILIQRMLDDEVAARLPKSEKDK